jgi:hypothetical protein
MAASPFKPFRICMSDGKSYDVSNHDAALVLANCVEVGIEPNPAGFAQRVARCAYLHITSIEDLQPA